MLEFQEFDTEANMKDQETESNAMAKEKGFNENLQVLITGKY